LSPLPNPVQTSVTVPGSKSYTIRALILAALVERPQGQPVRVWNVLRSDDGQAILDCLNALGIRTEWGKQAGQAYVDVFGQVRHIADTDYTLHANLSAATLRFLLAVSAVIPGRQTLLGHDGLNRRPVRDLVEALRALGVSIDYLGEEGYPPVRVNSCRLQASQLTVSGSTSSQYISALLMIAPLIEPEREASGQPVVIRLPEAPVSKPYLDMTLDIMRAFGVQGTQQDGYQRFEVPAGQTYTALSYVVEPDASSAAYFAAIATLTGSTITLKNLPLTSVQADMRFIEILKQMGTQVRVVDGDLLIEGYGVRPLPVVDMCDCPDQAQVLAVLAAFADGVTRIEGLQSLRVKETDRIAAVESELQKMGIRVEAEADALVIHGGQPQAARIATYGDHRMAMAFAVAGAVLDGLEIEDPAVVNKTYPGFWDDLRALGLGVSEVPTQSASEKSLERTNPKKIVLIGFMGAGKSSVARILAERCDRQAVDMDARILALSGRQSVTEIFDTDGETHFRALEVQVAEALGSASELIVATGGGVPANPQAMAALTAGATVVWLRVSWDTVWARLQHDSDRPLLRNLQQAQALFHQRQSVYQQVAHLQVDTEGKTPPAVADEIIQQLRLGAETLCPPLAPCCPA
jgi:3-phosphoshikimate 1-carboxyvinyltransferase